jgi:hypothetical protein
MIKLYSPQTEVDLALIRSILESEGISFFVHNDHFGSLRIGPSIPLYNERTIMVNENDFPRASELISDYLKNTRSKDVSKSNGAFQSEYSLFDKIRVIFETILFGWIVPGKSKKHSKIEEE